MLHDDARDGAVLPFLHQLHGRARRPEGNARRGKGQRVHELVELRKPRPLVENGGGGLGPLELRVLRERHRDDVLLGHTVVHQPLAVHGEAVNDGLDHLVALVVVAAAEVLVVGDGVLAVLGPDGEAQLGAVARVAALHVERGLVDQQDVCPGLRRIHRSRGARKAKAHDDDVKGSVPNLIGLLGHPHGRHSPQQSRRARRLEKPAPRGVHLDTPFVDPLCRSRPAL